MAVDEAGRFWFEGVSETGVSSLAETSESGTWLESEAGGAETIIVEYSVVASPLRH